MAKSIVLSRSIGYCWLVLALLSSLIGRCVEAADAAATQPPHTGLRLTSQTPDGAILEATVPAYTLTRTDQGQHRLSVGGASRTTAPGAPELPVLSALLGVPAGAHVSLRILQDQHKPAPGRFALTYAPHPAPLEQPLQPGAMLATPEPTSNPAAGWYPQQPARIGDDVMLRGRRLVRVEVFPFQYDQRVGQLLWHTQLRLELRWEVLAGSGQADAGGHDAQAPFEAGLERQVLNWEQAKGWQTPLGTRSDATLETPEVTPQADPQQNASIRLRIVVDHDGFYRIGPNDLRAAGVDPASIDPRTFHLTSQGTSVAIDSRGENDGRFDAGDRFIFYGQRLRDQTPQDTIIKNGKLVTTTTIMSALYSNATTYTDNNVYWLMIGGQAGPRMSAVDGAPTGAPTPTSFRSTVRAERSNVWWTFHFTNRDTWFWDQMQSTTDVTRVYTTTLTAPATDVPNATVRLSLVARSQNPSAAPDHRTRVALNGAHSVIADQTWDGLIRHTINVQAPTSLLREGENQLLVTSLKQPELDTINMYFDWFEIEYARRFVAENNQLFFGGDRAGAWQYQSTGFTNNVISIYNITNPTRPQAVTQARISGAAGNYGLAFAAQHAAGARFAAVADAALQTPLEITRPTGRDLRAAGLGADYLIITDHDFLASAARLAELRASQGMRSMVVDVDDVYNQFNEGVYNPVAIKRFLAHTFAAWQAPAPSYVVLVGDGHWNLKGYAPQRYGTEPIKMPPMLAWVDPWQGEVDSANLLAAVVGDDLMPDLAIGRLPVNTPAELNAVIDKIIAYEATPSPQEWQRHVLFVADNTPDAAGDFVAISNQAMAEQIPDDYTADRLYLNDICGAPASPATPCPAAGEELVSRLNTTGAFMVQYTGHASINRWAHEQILVNDMIPQLTNGDRLPVILSLTCLDGYWFYPGLSSLIEELVRADDRGAIATFSPTGLGVAVGHDILQAGFNRAVFKDGARRLGPATLAAKLALYTTGDHPDLINTFTIFGDPALKFALPDDGRSQVYLPLVRRGP